MSVFGAVQVQQSRCRDEDQAEPQQDVLGSGEGKSNDNASPEKPEDIPRGGEPQAGDEMAPVMGAACCMFCPKQMDNEEAMQAHLKVSDAPRHA